MASGKRRTNYNTRRNTRNTGSSRHKASEPLDSNLQNEIVLIVVLAFCVLLFLCNFGIVGKFGTILSNVEFGLFGILAYIAPVCIFFAVAFHIINRGSSAALRKLIAGIILFILIEMICELIAGRVFDMDHFQAAVFYTDAAENRSGGGFFVGMLTYLCLKYLSLVGSILLILVLGLISIVLITEKSILKKAGEGKFYAEVALENAAKKREEREQLRQKQYEQHQTEYEQRRESQEEKKKKILLEKEDKRREKQQQAEMIENEKILRMDRKSRGVMLDTTLTDDTAVLKADEKARDDIHEITWKEEDTPVSASELHEEVLHPEGVKAPDAEILSMPEPVTEYHPRTDEIKKVTPPDKPAAVFAAKDTIAKGNIATDTAEKILKSEKPVSTVGNSNSSPSAVYQFPPVSLLQKGKTSGNGDHTQELKETALNLQKTLTTFGVNVKVTDISQGPAVTRYELQPEQGVKVSRIVNLADDIKLNLAATDIRIEAPIPGKAAVGIEVPNRDISMVSFRDLIESSEYKNYSAKLSFAVGKDIAGKVVVTDLAKMPHLLIAGATGSGKSVCINTIIMSVLYKATPDEVKMILIDPKVVELSVYNGIPHLLLPVVTDPKKAAASLQWGVAEMTQRYQKFADWNVRDLKGYNKKAEEMRKSGVEDAPQNLPQVLIIVDELADLMMVAPGEVEESICRLAQLARAAGIHLVIATQRPSVDVITGLIKANMPSRIAFAVSSGVDSRTILDSVGAEKLLGKGDMLFYPQGYPKPTRIQGAFISDNEVQDVVDYLKNQKVICDYHPNIEEKLQNMESTQSASSSASSNSMDELFTEAGRFIIDKDKASIGMLQRVFKIGFNRAARIMDQLSEAGVVSEEDGTKPRKVLMSQEQFENYIEESV